MLINSVILILGETLEAALLISVLLAINTQSQRHSTWILFSFLGGIAGGSIYAYYMSSISEWFDYTGQEMINAQLHIGIACFLILFSWTHFSDKNNNDKQTVKFSKNLLCQLSALGAVALAITREGAEIILYLTGMLHQKDMILSTMLGTSLGFGIGISIGVLLFFSLISFTRQASQALYIILLAVFTGNMLSQASVQLMQADWLSSSQALWDTSHYISESSVVGQLLYALIGYESTPSFWQVSAYASGISLVLSASLLTTLKRKL